MKTNPYQPPTATFKSATDRGPRRIHDGRIAAGILVLLAASSLFYDLTYLLSDWLRQPAANGLGSLNGKLLLFTTGHFVVLYGCLAHCRHKTGPLTIAAAVIATTPILTPWFFLGFPFGLRMLVAKIMLHHRTNAAVKSQSIG